MAMTSLESLQLHAPRWMPASGFGTRVKVVENDIEATHLVEVDGKKTTLRIESMDFVLPEPPRRDEWVDWDLVKSAAVSAAVMTAVVITGVCAARVVALTFR
jgi:hypothetical protein